MLPTSAWTTVYVFFGFWQLCAEQVFRSLKHHNLEAMSSNVPWTVCPRPSHHRTGGCPKNCQSVYNKHFDAWILQLCAKPSLSFMHKYCYNGSMGATVSRSLKRIARTLYICTTWVQSISYVFELKVGHNWLWSRTSENSESSTIPNTKCNGKCGTIFQVLFPV